MTYIAIATIDTGSIRYVGTCLGNAAEQLEPGCCFAKGDWSSEAQSLAKASAATFRAAGYEMAYSGVLTKHNYRGSTRA